MIRNKYILFCVSIVCLCACNARSSIREARQTVAQADSLWAVGASYDDSLSLAQACETLDRWQWFNADDYAHACYHYGRLLRAKDHPVEAMQVFINATHSRTHDYHILGRVYSNMGDIAHLAGEYPLAYDMYEKSGEMYLRNGDTLLYYYDLNNMAFELAEQGKKDSTFHLIREIEEHCSNREVLLKTIETKVVVYKKSAQYDSVLFYTSQLLQYNNHDSFVLLNRAQAYSFLGKKDSAVCYAILTMHFTNDLSSQNGSLYILTHDDEAKDKNAIKKISSERSDVQKLIKIRQGKLSQATQLLQLDLNRESDLRWLFAVLTTIFVVSLSLWLYVSRKSRQHTLLSQRIEDLTIQNKKAAEQQNKQYNDRLLQIQENCKVLAKSDNLIDSLQWKNYAKFCECINIHFFLLADKLKAIGCLNEKEIRLCVLVLIGSFSDKQMADILYYSYNSIRSSKRTLAMKLGTTSANLRSFLIEKAAK